MEEEFKTLSERLRRRLGDWKEPTAEEYEAEMAPLREALRKAAEKTSAVPYTGLTIRQYFEFMQIAKGRPMSGLEEAHLYQISCDHDIDSPKDFSDWERFASHSMDLEYAHISLFAWHLNYLEEEPKKWLWEIRMMGHPGDPISMARYAKRLQEGGVEFTICRAQEVLRRFNREVGYRKRSLRRNEQLADMNDKNQTMEDKT